MEAHILISASQYNYILSLWNYNQYTLTVNITRNAEVSVPVKFATNSPSLTFRNAANNGFIM